MAKKECVAMLLAGGQGSRLFALTKKIAKPAVPFGGKYRIIDFTLSNCTNSGIDTIGILTQYEPHSLHSYVGNGQPWDLDKQNGGLYILSPYQHDGYSEWYKGTANAIYQNIKFVDSFEPEYVLVLSGDHVYKMDYSKMLAYHKKKKADCTVAVIDVPLEEAHRFGIMDTSHDGSITSFEEKPEEPKSTLASMGIYIFNWKKLKEYLIKDNETPESKNDFGRDIIPTMLKEGNKMYAYAFDGYWKDVGTIESLWETNMDMISKDSLDLLDDSWKIYSKCSNLPPHFIGENADVRSSIIAEGCYVDGNVEKTVVFAGVEIQKGANVRYSVLMPGVIVEEGAAVEFSIIGENSVIKKNAKVGQKVCNIENGNLGIAVVGSDLTIGSGVKVAANEIVETDIQSKKTR